jgi:protein gp37
MGDKTGIEWTDATWNPIRGCRRTAPKGSKQSGCGDPTGGGCYAERTAARFCGPGQPYEGLITLTAHGPRWSGKTRFVAEHLADPLRWRKPRRIFVDSMSDLFYEGFSDDDIERVFAIMALAPRHTFQVLTKRPQRMREWMSKENRRGSVIGRAWEMLGRASSGVPRLYRHDGIGDRAWPLPNVCLGVSVENQAAADERIPPLLETAAAVRFISAEPLLGQVDLTCLNDGSWYDAEGAQCYDATRGLAYYRDGEHGLGGGPRIDWVIAGCESGPGARPIGADAFRSLRDQCAAAGVAFFLKQATEEVTWDGNNEHECTLLAGPGSHRKPGGVIGAPYLDGVQHLACPRS